MLNINTLWIRSQLIFKSQSRRGLDKFMQRLCKNYGKNCAIFALPKLILLQIIFMRVLIQRVSTASVKIDGKMKAAIQKGLLIFVGIEDSDTEEDIKWLSNKIVNLRIFDEENHVPNISVKEINGDILLVSQFTLHANTKKGNRPSYIKASKPETAIPIYEKMINQLTKDLEKPIFTGEFGADMKVELLNDGPVTIWIDSKNKE